MPIKIPNELPATKTLNDENIFVMSETRAGMQDIRPLRILLLNLMPTKIDTETQLSRLLGNTPLQVELTLIHTKSHQSKNTSQEHLLAFYKTFDAVKDEKFDGMIITGKPYLTGGTVFSYNDHRIAMSASVASVVCKNGVTILGAEAVNKSYPEFYEKIKALGSSVKEI